MGWRLYVGGGMIVELNLETESLSWILRKPHLTSGENQPQTLRGEGLLTALARKCPLLFL